MQKWSGNWSQKRNVYYVFNPFDLFGFHWKTCHSFGKWNLSKQKLEISLNGEQLSKEFQAFRQRKLNTGTETDRRQGIFQIKVQIIRDSIHERTSLNSNPVLPK